MQSTADLAILTAPANGRKMPRSARQKKNSVPPLSLVLPSHDAIHDTWIVNELMLLL